MIYIYIYSTYSSDGIFDGAANGDYWVYTEGINGINDSMKMEFSDA